MEKNLALYSATAFAGVALASIIGLRAGIGGGASADPVEPPPPEPAELHASTRPVAAVDSSGAPAPMAQVTSSLAGAPATGVAPRNEDSLRIRTARREDDEDDKDDEHDDDRGPRSEDHGGDR
jgi:hypothetical protein